jgi:hypothetical protein
VKEQNDRDKITLGSENDLLSGSNFKSKGDETGTCEHGRDGKPNIKAFDMTVTVIRWGSDDGRPMRLALRPLLLGRWLLCWLSISHCRCIPRPMCHYVKWCLGAQCEVIIV